jgi:hypothetical protein
LSIVRLEVVELLDSNVPKPTRKCQIARRKRRSSPTALEKSGVPQDFRTVLRIVSEILSAFGA